MLFKQDILERVKHGKVTMAFRRWKKPAVKPGGLQKTSIGVLRFDTIKPITEKQLTNALAAKAGYTDKDTLLKELSSRTQGTLYQINFHLHGKDPRLALREIPINTKPDFQELHQRLVRLERQGKWVKKVLEIIKAYPHTRAGDLAAKLGVEKEWLKLHVRKLKNHGLTISFEPSYTLSPRGHTYLNALKKNIFGA